MNTNLITLLSFASRLSAQFLILTLAFTFLEQVDYRLFLLLSFLGSFLSVFDFGLLGTATKKLSYIHFKTNKFYNNALRSIFITLAIIISILFISFFGVNSVVSDPATLDISSTILITYFLVFFTNYTFSVTSNINFSTENVISARKIEILKHTLNILSALLFIGVYGNLLHYFILLILFNLICISIGFRSFYNTNKDRILLELKFEKEFDGNLRWRSDFIRSSGSEVIFKFILFYLAITISSFSELENGNVALTIIKILDMCSVLTLQFLWSNIKNLNNFKSLKQAFVKFQIYFLLLITFALLTSSVILTYFNIYVTRDTLFLLCLAGYFFWLWRCIAFVELITNLKNVYWQHVPAILTIFWLTAIAAIEFYVNYSNVIFDLLLFLPVCHLIYFSYIRKVLLSV